MPVPKPEPGEKERDFISRCISALHKTDPDRPDDQIIAMCYTSWRESEQVVQEDEWLVPFKARRLIK